MSSFACKSILGYYIHPTDIQDQGAIRQAMAGARLQRAFAAFCSTRKQKVPGVDRMVGICVAPKIVHVKDKQNIEMEKSYFAKPGIFIWISLRLIELKMQMLCS